MKFNLKRKEVNEQFAQAANEPIYKKAEAVGLAIGTTVMSGMAFADGPDVSGVVTAIGLVATAVGLVGAAIVLVKLGVKTYKWVSSSL